MNEMITGVLSVTGASAVTSWLSAPATASVNVVASLIVTSNVPAASSPGAIVWITLVAPIRIDPFVALVVGHGSVEFPPIETEDGVAVNVLIVAVFGPRTVTVRGFVDCISPLIAV